MIEEEDIDIDELIEQEGDEPEEELKEQDAKKKISWDEEQLELLLRAADEGDDGLADDGEDEEEIMD